MKQFVAGMLVLALIFAPCSEVFAKGGGHGGGGGHSSHSSTSSRTSAPSGRTYSTGSTSKPSSSKPIASSSIPKSTGKTYSTGSTQQTQHASNAPKPAPKATSPSGKTYTSGTTTQPKQQPAPVGKTYSSENKQPVASVPQKANPSTGPPKQNVVSTDGQSRKPGSSDPKPNTNNNVTPKSEPQKPIVANKSDDGKSRKPTNGSTLNKDLSNSAKQQESKDKYVAATKPAATPKSTYKTPGPNGVEKPVQANSPQVTTVRNYVTHERYVTYDNRCMGFYGGYYGHPYYYHDSFSPFLMGWLLSDALNSHQRALWMYNHQYDMDSSRYDEMLRRDARLQAEIDQLKAQNVTRNPAYVPPQMADNPDVMYNKEFVDAAYNPQEVQQPVTQTQPRVVPQQHTSFAKVMFYILLGGLACGAIYYFMFVKEF